MQCVSTKEVGSMTCTFSKMERKITAYSKKERLQVWEHLAATTQEASRYLCTKRGKKSRQQNMKRQVKTLRLDANRIGNHNARQVQAGNAEGERTNVRRRRCAGNAENKQEKLWTKQTQRAARVRDTQGNLRYRNGKLEEGWAPTNKASRRASAQKVKRKLLITRRAEDWGKILKHQGQVGRIMNQRKSWSESNAVGWTTTE